MGGPDQVKELRTGCGSSRRGASGSDPVTPQKLGTDKPTFKLLGRHAEAGMPKRTDAFTPALCRKLRSQLQRATDRTDPPRSSRGGVQRANGRCCDGHEGPFIACSRFGSSDYSRTAVPWVLGTNYVISMSPKKRSRTSKDFASSMTEISAFQTQVASSDLLVNGI